MTDSEANYWYAYYSSTDLVPKHKRYTDSGNTVYHFINLKYVTDNTNYELCSIDIPLGDGWYRTEYKARVFRKWRGSPPRFNTELIWTTFFKQRQNQRKQAPKRIYIKACIS